MNKNWTAAILVGGGVGTGYALAPDRILTSRHVVRPKLAKGRRSAEPAMQVRLVHVGMECGVRKVLWECEDLDVAVIQLDELLEPLRTAQASWLLSKVTPQTGAAWESEGFPRAEDAPRTEVKPHPIGGTLHAPASGQSKLMIDVKTKPDVWNGMSGAPVFVQHRLVGVIRAIEPGYRGDRLEATAVSALLAIPEFCAAVGFTSPLQELSERLTREIGGLEGSARGELAKELEVSPPADVDQQAQAMLRLGALALTDKLEALSHPGGDSARAAARMLELVLPYCIDWHTSVQPLRERSAAHAEVLRLSVAHDSLVAAVLAAADGAPCRLRLVAGDVAGAGSVSHSAALEGGFDRKGEQLVRDLVEELATVVFAIPAMPYEQRLDEVRAALARERRRAPTDPRFVPKYVVIDRPGIGAGVLDQIASLVKQTLPELQVARLDTKDSAQLEIVQNIRAILRRAQDVDAPNTKKTTGKKR